MKMQNNRTTQWRWIYIVLLLASLILTRIQRILPEALNRTRYGGGGLLPFDGLMIKHIGVLSQPIPILLLILFALSWKIPKMNSAPAIAITSTALLLFLGVYSIFCIVALFMHL
jgi:hypothetical protein